VATPFGKVDVESGSCFALAFEVKLRSLELLHVAHLISMKNGGFTIESLLTSDSDFSKAQKFLKEQGVKLIVLGSRRDGLLRENCDRGGISLRTPDFAELSITGRK
jgi:hypothetical protein